MQDLLVGVSVIVGAIIIARSHKTMTDAVTDAISNLTKEVGETLTSVAEAIRAAAAGSDQAHIAAAINEQAARLDALQASIAPAPPAEEPAPEPTEGGEDTVSGDGE